MKDEHNCYAVINKDTRLIIFIGGLDACIKTCSECNAKNNNLQYIVSEHKTSNYAFKLINKNQGVGQLTTKTNQIIHVKLPQSVSKAPVLLPDPSPKEIVAAYLKKIQTK